MEEESKLCLWVNLLVSYKRVLVHEFARPHSFVN